MGQEDESKLLWHLDSGINQLLCSALSDKEFKELEETKFMKISWIQRKFESKILSAMQVVISGEKFGEDALHQAQVMEEKVQQLKKSPIK